jgi:hypothetical protein
MEETFPAAMMHVGTMGSRFFPGLADPGFWQSFSAEQPGDEVLFK